MALDVTGDGALKRRNRLQERLWQARSPFLRADERKASPRTLFRAIRTYLIKAIDHRLLDSSQAEVHAHVKLAQLADGKFSIAVGDRRNFRRDPRLPHFRRLSDQAWFDFQLVGEERSRGIEILAYDFELRLPDDSYVRFDLNPPDHDNEVHGLRCHMHVNSDDDGMAVPAPVMCPFELLDVMIHGLVRTGRQRRTDLTEPHPHLPGTDHHPE